MSKQYNNKTLILILSVLAVIMILTLVFRIPKSNATLKSRILDLDTAEISKIVIYPKLMAGDPVEFNRAGANWTVRQGAIQSATRENAVQSIFSGLINLKPQNLAAVNPSRWKEFELTDSLAVRIKFLDKNQKVLGDLMVGKLSYKQVNDPYAQYGGNNIQGTSYVRLYDEKEVYGVDGFLSFMFSGGFDSWRDKTFIRFNNNDIVSIAFTYPADSGYILNKNESHWFAGGTEADSLKTTQFLNAISNLNGQEIMDDFKPVSNPEYQALAEGNNLVNFTVKAYKGSSEDEYILNSSLNPEVYFTSKKEGIFGKIFKPRAYFLKP